jgi:hypothetical protein
MIMSHWEFLMLRDARTNGFRVGTGRAGIVSVWADLDSRASAWRRIRKGPISAETASAVNHPLISRPLAVQTALIYIDTGRLRASPVLHGVP